VRSLRSSWGELVAVPWPPKDSIGCEATWQPSDIARAMFRAVISTSEVSKAGQATTKAKREPLDTEHWLSVS